MMVQIEKMGPFQYRSMSRKRVQCLWNEAEQSVRGLNLPSRTESPEIRRQTVAAKR